MIKVSFDGYSESDEYIDNIRINEPYYKPLWFRLIQIQCVITDY